MAIANPEWRNRAAISVQPEISISDRFKLAMELMATNIGQVIGRLANPPYPTADGKPLRVIHYPDGQGPILLTTAQLDSLLKQIRGIKSTW